MNDAECADFIEWETIKKISDFTFRIMEENSSKIDHNFSTKMTIPRKIKI